MIRTVIVEDEPSSSEYLASLLSDFCNNVELVGTACDVKSGYELIFKSKPDLVLLDIEMPDGTGFDLLHKFPKINFEIIFTTAFAEYAVKAFQFSAIHYLLKPIDPRELVSAINKAEDELQRKNTEARVDALLFNMQNQAEKGKKIVLSSGTKIYVINSSEIVMCQSEKNYTQFFLADGREIVVAKTMKEYDDMLADNGFVRVHKQHLINVEHIKSLDKTEGGSIYLSNNLKVPVSVRKKELVIELLNRH